MPSLPRAAAGLLALVLGFDGAAPRDALSAIAAANGTPTALHLRLRGRATIAGERADVTLETDGIRRLERICDGEPACFGRYDDGRRGFAFGPNDVALPDDDPGAPLARAIDAAATLAFTDPAFAAAGGTARERSRDRWEVRAPGGGGAVIVVLDPRTRVPQRIETPEGTTLETLGDVRRVGRALIPFERGMADTRISFATAERIDAPLAPPSAPRPALAAAPPLALAREAIPIVACRVASLAARCLLDTGATPSAMTLRFAERLGLEPRGRLVLRGFGEVLSGVVERGPLVLGGAAWSAPRFAVVPLGVELGFDVVVGSDLLATTPLTIDAASGTVTLGAASGGAAIPLRWLEGLPYLALTVRGRPYEALFDTGDSAAVSLGYDEFRAAFLDVPPGAPGQARGLAGGGDAFAIGPLEVRAGSLALGALTVRVVRGRHGAHLGIAAARGPCARLVLELAASQARCAPGP